MKEKIIDIVSTSLKIKKSDISAKTSMNTVEEWDSLKQMQIILAVEEEFGIKLSEDDLFNLNSVGKLINAINKTQDN